MGLSYYDGSVSSDGAFDGTWSLFRKVVERIEAKAFEMDLYMRTALASHPIAGADFLIETNSLGNLRELIDDEEKYERIVRDGVRDADKIQYVALDLITMAAQIEVGRLWMLSARFRRVVRESYRAMRWQVSNAPIEHWNDSVPIDFSGLKITMSDVALGDHATFVAWVKEAIVHEKTHLRPLSVYGQIKAHVNTVRRGERWLRLASRVCEESASQIHIQEVGFMKIPDDTDAGMLKDDGQVDDRGFPYVRTVGCGVPTLGMRVDTLEGDSFEIFEIDQAVDETPLRFRAKGDPFASGEESLRDLTLRAATDTHPQVFEAWMRLGPQLLEDVTPFQIPEVEDISREQEDS